MWFTETPWPPMAICVAAAVLLAAAWYQNRRAVWLFGSLVALVATGGIWVVEQQIVTEPERVEQLVVEMVTAFQQQDVDRTLSYFAENNERDRGLLKGAIKIVHVHDDLQIRDVTVTLTSGATRAVSRFRANATIEVPHYTGHQPSRWEITWEKIAGHWKIIRVTRLDPLTGEEKGILQAQ